MNRTWFPSSRGSFLHHAAVPDNGARHRGSPPRDKTWAAVIECGLFGGIALFFALKVIW
jgi:hypothetical protein